MTTHYAPYGPPQGQKHICGEPTPNSAYTDIPGRVTCEGCKKSSPGIWPGKCDHPNKVALEPKTILGWYPSEGDECWSCPDCGQCWLFRPGYKPNFYVQVVADPATRAAKAILDDYKERGGDGSRILSEGGIANIIRKSFAKEKPVKKTYAYHKPSATGIATIGQLREHFSNLHDIIEKLAPNSREKSVALTNLETAAMWAIKAVVCNDPESVVDG